MKPSAVLIGPPAAGKSRIGKSAAKILGLPFIDTDSRVVDKHGPIPEIFASVGEAQFREWERTEVRAALADSGIVALGGGAIENEDTRHELAQHSVVLVTVSADAVAPRLESGKRPLLNGIESWRALVDRRRGWYDELATEVLDTSTGPMDLHAQRLAEIVRSWR